MKKVISVLLAVLMLAALMVPAFAATIDQTGGNPATGGATVKTDTSAVTGDGAYTVTYDAEISVPWNSTAAVSSNYTVETHLKTGKQLQVTATSDGIMTYNALELPYTLGGDTAYGDTAYTAGAAETATKAITVTVAQSAWDEAPIADYTDTITYSATII